MPGRNPSIEKTFVDESAAVAALAGSRELLRDLAVMFSEDAPSTLEVLRQSLEANDAVQVRHTVHSLKGMASTFYAKNAVDLAQRLEDAAAQGSLSEFADGGLPDLENAILAIIEELKALGLVD